MLGAMSTRFFSSSPEPSKAEQDIPEGNMAQYLPYFASVHHFHFWTLYEKTGKIDEMLTLFRTIQHKPKEYSLRTAYERIIHALCVYQRKDEAFQIFQEMEEIDRTPNSYFYILYHFKKALTPAEIDKMKGLFKRDLYTTWHTLDEDPMDGYSNEIKRIKKLLYLPADQVTHREHSMHSPAKQALIKKESARALEQNKNAFLQMLDCQAGESIMGKYVDVLGWDPKKNAAEQYNNLSEKQIAALVAELQKNASPDLIKRMTRKGPLIK